MSNSSAVLNLMGSSLHAYSQLIIEDHGSVNRVILIKYAIFT